MHHNIEGTSAGDRLLCDVVWDCVATDYLIEFMAIVAVRRVLHRKAMSLRDAIIFVRGPGLGRSVEEEFALKHKGEGILRAHGDATHEVGAFDTDTRTHRERRRATVEVQTERATATGDADVEDSAIIDH